VSHPGSRSASPIRSGMPVKNHSSSTSLLCSTTPKNLGRDFQGASYSVPARQIGALSGCDNLGLRRGPIGHRAFYCAADQKVYIDLGFYDELQQRFGAPGQFAQAYVLAHELGHHIQNLLGIERRVRNLQGQNPGAGNALSVRMELQADCFALVWAEVDATTRSARPRRC
jgi:uncharacterized protein